MAGGRNLLIRECNFPCITRAPEAKICAAEHTFASSVRLPRSLSHGIASGAAARTASLTSPVTCDQTRATRLCGQGRAFLSRNNDEGLKSVVRELWKLMPADAVEEQKRGYRSGIVKGRA